MATPPDKPSDAAGTKPPAPRKPATPRKTVRKTAASAAPKPDARKAETTSASSAAEAKPAVSQSSAASSASSSAKPAAPRKRAAPKPTTPRAAPAKRAPAKAATPKSTVRKAAGTGTGRRWGIAAAVTAAGAVVTAGLLALRGSTPASDDPNKPNEGKTAHQADGTDSSKSFEAGIADEGTIPE